MNAANTFTTEHTEHTETNQAKCSVRFPEMMDYAFNVIEF